MTSWWSTTGRSTHAIIDLDAITANVGAIRALVTPGTQVMAVVKANAYGHGAVPVARTAVEAGAAALGVATVDEGVELRDAGLRVAVVVLGPISAPEIATAIRAQLHISIDTPESAKLIAEAAKEIPGNRACVHLKLDSGMRRFGGTHDAVLAAASLVSGSDHLELAGVFTHFADADGDDISFTNEQTAYFREVVAQLATEGIVPRWTHAANSAALLRSRAFDFDIVRLGISLYGLQPDPRICLAAGMCPALGVRTRVTRVFDLEPGDTVSYGRTYQATASERAALLPVGYADGLPRALSNAGWVGIGGERCQILGRVCMDQTVVGIPATLDVQVGDPVDVMGTGTGPSLDEVALQADTIGYEIATRIATRVPRWYLRDGQVVGRWLNGKDIGLDGM